MTATFELDHVVIWSTPGASEADDLFRLGFAERPGRIHPGQGTANRCAIFRNAMVEFLWVTNEREAQLAGGRKIRLCDRWRLRERAASPFGICLRPGEGGRPSDPPFAGWAYRPSTLPDPLFTHMDDQSETIALPLMFYLPHAARDDWTGKAPRHDAGVAELAALRVTGPGYAAVNGKCGGPEPSMACADGDSPTLELVFDDGSAGMVADLSPLLPLKLRW